MTVRGVDVESAFDDPDDGWFGRAARMDETPVQERLAADADDTDSWYVPAADPGSTEFVDDVRQDPPEHVPESELAPAQRNGFVAAPRPASWESRICDSGAWQFKTPPASRPWYRSPLAAVAVIVAVVALAGTALLLHAPGAAVEDSTTVAPSASSAPAPSPQAPVPPPPGLPPLPPPPPPAAEEISPPAVERQYSPSYHTPDEPKKPQLNVTRAPMSATPPPPPKPDRNSATPGDGRKRGGFHF